MALESGYWLAEDVEVTLDPHSFKIDGADFPYHTAITSMKVDTESQAPWQILWVPIIVTRSIKLTSDKGA